MCKDPKIATLMDSDAVKLPYETTQVALLNRKCTHLKFFAQERPGYFVDAIAPITTVDATTEVKSLQLALGTGDTIRIGSQNFFIVRNVNDSSGPLGSAEKVSRLTQ